MQSWILTNIGNTPHKRQILTNELESHKHAHKHKRNIIRKDSSDSNDSSDSSILRVDVSRLVDTMVPKVFLKRSTTKRCIEILPIYSKLIRHQQFSERHISSNVNKIWKDKREEGEKIKSDFNIVRVRNCPEITIFVFLSLSEVAVIDSLTDRQGVKS